jgi:hypothetical protein
MAEINATLKQLRLIQAGIVLFLFISITLGELAPKRSVPPWSFSHSLMAALGLVCLLEAFNFRYRFLPAAAAKLARNVADAAALRRWRAWQLMCIAMAASSAFYGIVIRMALHGPLWQALLFYVPGICLLLIWTPRLPAPAPR